ncbi:MAG: phospho-N-acetylmuramoyl-pentapeptide-transferase [Eubacteriaceae bacterium]|jgi:phospho-N-acetylmuramoyl-pentapeptide-transferase|nr:phospho-N-acetylmuramoyl-pentapeptide-transferase [Eubacteriaceae bacterium]
MSKAILTTLLSFLIVVASSPMAIEALKKLNIGQSVRLLGPTSHYGKAGTPTMGGLVIIVAVAASCLIASKGADSSLLFAVIVTVVFGVIGFLDDFIKMVQKSVTPSEKGVTASSLGMLPSHKLVLQIAVALALAVFAAYHPDIGTGIQIPFTYFVLDLGVFYIPFTVITVVAVVNAVNFTDGLDGLASGVTLIVFIFFFLYALSDGKPSMGTFGASVIGACMGFLVYNFNPAKVFMGDTGSMALGGAVSAISILTRTELFILIAGLIYAIELLSVAIQVSYFRISGGKRVFKMAPIHHHFELLGWQETRIVIVFWVFTAVCVLISMLSIPYSF